MGDEGGTSRVTTQFTARTDCYAAGSVWICGRDLAATPGLHKIDGRALRSAEHQDAAIPLNTPPANPHLLSGWSKPESSGVWSEASRAVLRLPHPDVPSGGTLVVGVEALCFQPPGRPAQRAIVSVAGERLAEWRLDSGGYHFWQVMVPARLLQPGKPLDVVLDLPDALVPAQIEPASHDNRKLGIGVKSVTLAH